MSQVDPYIAGLAMRSGGNLDTLTPGERLDLENAMGPNLTSAQLGDIAQGKIPQGLSVGGDTMAPDSMDAMIDREMASRGSTVSQKDIELAEMHARQGNEVQAANVAGGAGALDAATDRAQLQQAGGDYMMNARPGESVADYEARRAEEAKQKDGQEKGGVGEMVAGFFGGAMAMFGLQKANEAIAGNLTPEDDRAAKHEGYMLVAGNENAVQSYRDFGREPIVEAGVAEGASRAASIGAAMGQQQQAARDDAGGMMRTLNA